MLAIFKTGGKQYTVENGQKLKVEKLEGKKGDSISFKNVLAISNASNHTIGNPLIIGASVEATILEQIRDKKIIVFKKRKRQNYRHTQGHRQYLTILKIESISLDGKKNTLSKKEIVSKKLDNKKITDVSKTPKKKTMDNKTVKKTVKKTATKKPDQIIK